MYIVVDDNKLNVEAGYVAYSAAVKWGTIKDKPSTFPPSAHTQDWSTITGKPSSFTPSGHTHTKNQITDFPSSLKNPSALTIQANGATLGSYDGSATKTFNITASNVGAFLLIIIMILHIVKLLTLIQQDKLEHIQKEK